MNGSLFLNVIAIYNSYGFETEVIVASIRNPIHVLDRVEFAEVYRQLSESVKEVYPGREQAKYDNLFRMVLNCPTQRLKKELMIMNFIHL